MWGSLQIRGNMKQVDYSTEIFKLSRVATSHWELSANTQTGALLI